MDWTDLDLDTNFLSTGDLVVWLAGMEKVDEANYTENDVYLMKQVREALTMLGDVDVLDDLIHNDRIDSYLDEQLNDIYGKAAVDFLGQWMDWEQCYNALKMDWGTVTIGEHDWWYRK